MIALHVLFTTAEQMHVTPMNKSKTQYFRRQQFTGQNGLEKKE